MVHSASHRRRSNASSRSQDSISSSHSSEHGKVANNSFHLDPTHEKTLRTVRKLRNAGYRDKDFERLFGMTKEELAKAKSSENHNHAARANKKTRKDSTARPFSFHQSFDLPVFSTDDEEPTEPLSSRSRASTHTPTHLASPRSSRFSHSSHAATREEVNRRHSIAAGVAAITHPPKRPRRTAARRIKELGKGIGQILAPLIGPIP
ncbi:hypothetical protein J8273_0420 [Carpediemonas membranifera]|uniref:Uncharacterized protein n=1 Tax=Carpediemonas membranifera TaxID=201153 RepID=A0A8J6EAR9_9EUKA|nr:hypothetical protein J8273_0420 [Carpediemonas membranifera]|eukprot:KAG9395200.1 hypothetical protein J8273_0420 [Carpediemonas membranifera]